MLYRRRRLGQIIDKVDAGQGELVIDLELVFVADDENDQGYYDDEAVSPEDIKELVRQNNESMKARGQISDDNQAIILEPNKPNPPVLLNNVM